jgi:glutathione S-transferase
MLRNRSKAFANRALPGPLDVPQIPELVERGKLQLAYILPQLDRELGTRPWLAGKSFTFADIDLLVAIDFMAWVRESIPEDCTHLRAWHDRARAELGL